MSLQGVAETVGSDLGVDGLRPTRNGKRVGFDEWVADGRSEGYFVPGYRIWELPSIDNAVAWLTGCPNPMPVPSKIKLGPFFDDTETRICAPLPETRPLAPQSAEPALIASVSSSA